MDKLQETHTWPIIEGEYHSPDDMAEDGRGPFLLVRIEDADGFVSFLTDRRQSYGRVRRGDHSFIMISGVPGFQLMPDGTVNPRIVVGGGRAHCWYLRDGDTLVWTDYNPVML